MIENASNRTFVERVLFEADITYVPVQEISLSGRSSDLSISGLYLRTRFPLDVDETVQLKFLLPLRNKHVDLSCQARVAWLNYAKDRRKPDSSSGVGVQFLDLSDDETALLAQFIDSYDQTKKMNVVCAWCGNHLGIRKGPFGKTSHGICENCLEGLKS